jgi:hypothetical protein
MPPFPSGKRETAQHREWMALYKAQQRMHGRAADPDPRTVERVRELLEAQRSRCPICRTPLELSAARLDTASPVSPDAGPADAVLHPACLELVVLVRTLGDDAVERARLRGRAPTAE